MTGNEPCTALNVKLMLTRHHNYSEAEATALLTKHAGEVERGVRADSFVYYPVDQILEAEKHECDERCKDLDGSNEDED